MRLPCHLRWRIQVSIKKPLSQTPSIPLFSDKLAYYRRAVFWGTFFEELEGMTEIRNPSMDLFRPYVPDIAGFIEKGHKPGQSCICTGKIRRKGKSTLIDQFEYLKILIPKERWGEIKLTMIAPPWYHLRYKDGLAFPPEIYASDEEYLADISKAVSEELDILYAAGVRNIQFDDPNFACKSRNSA